MPTKISPQKKILPKTNKEKNSALFIPAGVLLGMGAGFAFNNLPA